jgi:hypothetical protein
MEVHVPRKRQHPEADAPGKQQEQQQRKKSKLGRSSSSGNNKRRQSSSSATRSVLESMEEAVAAPPPAARVSLDAPSSSSAIDLTDSPTTYPSTTTARRRKGKGDDDDDDDGGGRSRDAVVAGARLAVYWPDDDEHYACAVRRVVVDGGEGQRPLHELLYDDGMEETIDLSTQRYRIIDDDGGGGGGEKRPARGGGGVVNGMDDNDDVGAKSPPDLASASSSSVMKGGDAANNAVRRGGGEGSSSGDRVDATATAAPEEDAAESERATNWKKKKKKLSFHDHILHTMLTSCRPYTLKTLASASSTTTEALQHAMLSFLDKGSVVCKEFPTSGKGGGGGQREPRRLYWANPASLADIEAAATAAGGGGKGGGGGGGKGGGGAVFRELSRLLSTSREMEEASAERRDLERRYRAVREELDPMSDIPTMRELDDELAEAELGLSRLREEIGAARHRISSASRDAATPVGAAAAARRSSAAPPARRPQPRDPTTLKRMINHMLGEYKSRKRKCMDFVEELSEAMEKKTRDVLGEKVLCLDTDEAEWGLWEDGSLPGRLLGTKKPNKQSRVGGGSRGGKLGRKDDEGETDVVKIPARYKDV